MGVSGGLRRVSPEGRGGGQSQTGPGDGQTAGREQQQQQRRAERPLQRVVPQPVHVPRQLLAQETSPGGARSAGTDSPHSHHRFNATFVVPTSAASLWCLSTRLRECVAPQPTYNVSMTAHRAFILADSFF